MTLITLLVGASAMASLTIALFFLRFWKSSRDRFFVFFASAFVLEGISRVVMMLEGLKIDDENISLIRLFAYLLILIAILDKNWRSRS